MAKQYKNSLKENFSRLKEVCYLDHAGSTLYANSQIDAFTEDLRNNIYGNPHSLNLSSKYCHDSIDQIRFKILEHFGSNAEEYSVVFTSGATSSLKSVVEWFNWDSSTEDSSHYVYMQDNHTSVLGLREIIPNDVKIHCLKHEEAFAHFYPKTIKNDFEREVNCLFVYSAQCNFSGCKYPLEWIRKVHNGALDEYICRGSSLKHHRWFCLLDAAAFLPTNRLDLNVFKPDFVAVSFHKIFGFPTGLGAILVRNSSDRILNKAYYGGGTVLITLSDERFHVKRPSLHERCEDGTINYLSVLSLKHGFETISRLNGSMDEISEKVFHLSQYVHEKLLRLHHHNGNPAVIVYRDTDYSDINFQGGIINFNLLRDNGDYIGHAEVLNLANMYNIHLRTGCFCNPGACQRHLKLSNEDLRNNYQKGHTCADNIDLIDGRPTGSIRVSFGYMTDIEDCDKLLEMICNCFVSQPIVLKNPNSWLTESEALRMKFKLIPDDCDYFTTPGDNEASENEPNISRAGFSVIKEEIKLSTIFVYPIKSCGAFSVSSKWTITPTGLKYDREWMIIDKNGVAVTQKQIPEMCLIIPEINLQSNLLTLNFEGSESGFSLPLNENTGKTQLSSICRSKVCDDKAEVVDCGDKIAKWLENNLRTRGIRLVRLINRCKISSKNRESLSLANQAQYLLITLPSVEWLTQQMPSDFECSTSDMLRRFRSNFVIRGNIFPLGEHTWNELKIGSINFKVDGPCGRCQMICINQSSGKKNKEPLRVLSSALKGNLRFGIYLSLLSPSNEYEIELDQSIIPVCYQN